MESLRKTGREIPVFIHHEGRGKYVGVCVKQAFKFHKRVVLFGDKHNKKMAAEWYDVSSFSSDLYDRFRKVFINMSNYTDSYALQIFKRFFIFYDFMEKNKIEECICLDSDVLIFINFTEIEKLKKYDAALCTPKNQKNNRYATNAGCAYWKKDALRDFLLFCIKNYSRDNRLLADKWKYHKKNHLGGGVGEMMFLYLWQRENKHKIWNWVMFSNAGVVDANYGSSENYFKNEYIIDKFGIGKKVVYREGKPYVKNNRYQKIVPVWSLHFWADRKAYMKYFEKGITLNTVIVSKERIIKKAKDFASNLYIHLEGAVCK